MSLKKLAQSVLSEAGLTLCAGILFLLLAREILATGMIRNVIAIGDAKYLVATILFLFGSVVAYTGIRAAALNYRELMSNENDEDFNSTRRNG